MIICDNNNVIGGNCVKKKFILDEAKNTLELLSINGINIATIGLIFKGSDILLNQGFNSVPIIACKYFLTVGVLTVNFAYTNYNLYNKKQLMKERYNGKF